MSRAAKTVNKAREKAAKMAKAASNVTVLRSDGGDGAGGGGSEPAGGNSASVGGGVEKKNSMKKRHKVQDLPGKVT